MKLKDNQYGKPGLLYKDTKTNIEALSAVEGMVAYATDTHEQGYYNGTNWVWGSATDGGIALLSSDYSTSDITVNPDPAEYTAISGIQADFSLTETHVVRVQLMIIKSAAHPDRFQIFDNTSQILPINAVSSGYYDRVSQEVGEYKLIIDAFVSMTSGDHSITIKHTAALSTASITFKEIFLTITQLD